MANIGLRSIAVFVALTAVCALPFGAHAEGASTNSRAALSEGGGGRAFCFNTPSGESVCAFSAFCDELVACTRDSDCAAGMACAVNTCCVDPSPNVCVPVATDFVCRATGPFACTDPPFFPACVLAAAPAPTLSPPLLAVGVLLLIGVGTLAMRIARRAS